ncbi:MAG: glutamate-1-semialdehyde 2,1-aminomutase [Cellvibrionaceae bacterium]|jgi:glutamate-1-semialdehyde 2,1-aminomutase
MNISKSIQLFSEACQVLPGGVDSPARAFRPVGGQPLFMERGEGAYLFDEDGNRFVDYVLSFGPLVLGHAHPLVLADLMATAAKGTSFGAPSKLETQLAKLVMSFMPSIEMVRFVNSGTEATMSALRLARAFTGRNKIIKFKGNYHGHADMLLVQAGSAVASLGLPDSPGVPPAAVADTLVAQFNDLDGVAQLFAAYPEEIACVIVEPVAGNMGVVPPNPGFLAGLKEMCHKHHSLLLFDEVMTGWRVHLGGAQTLYDVKPDITALGKVIGGGLPVGAYGGRRDIMEMVAPIGPMYQAGTLSGNPLAMQAGITTLTQLQKPGVFDSMVAAATKITAGIAEAAARAGVPITQNQVGTMFCSFFTDQPVTDWPSAANSDTAAFGRFFNGMLENGVYLAPAQFEAGFVSTMHDDTTLEITLAAASKAFAAV